METIRIALPKGRNLKPSVELFKAIGFDFTESLGDSRKLIFEAPGEQTGIKASAIIVRDADVPTYVENGAADFGVSGADQLAEQQRDLYEPVDLGFGYCRLVVAEPKALSERDNPKEWVHVKVATKFVGITERYFARRGVQIEVVKLYGSIELAPLVGLSDRIVDLVSTGATLKQNGLVEVEQIMEATARLVVNRASMRTKRSTVAKIIEDITDVLPSLDLPKYA